MTFEEEMEIARRVREYSKTREKERVKRINQESIKTEINPNKSKIKEKT